MKIGIYAPFYHPFEGGAERVARRVAQELSSRHEVTVFTLHYQSHLLTDEQDGNVRVLRFPYEQRKPAGLTLLQAPLLIDALEQADLDIVQLHGVTFPNISASIVWRLHARHIPTMLVPHGLFEAFHGDTKQSFAKRTLYLASVRTLLAALIWGASHVAMTSPEEQTLLHWFRLPAARSTLVYNGFEPPKSESADAIRFRKRYALANAPIIYHVASVKPNKGHDIVIQALPDVLSTCPEVRYVIVGQTDGLWRQYAQELMKQVEASGIEQHVVFTGRISDEELADGYAASDIAILPSLAETFPLTVLDAMAWQKPVVATNVGGIAHMLEDQRSGLIVPPGDPSALAQALAHLLHSKPLRHQLGQYAGHVVTKKFDWKQVIERYERICFTLKTAI